MFYIDSADVQESETWLRRGLVTGVTTNPTLVKRAGVGAGEFPELLRRWRSAGAADVCFQAWGADAPALVEHGRMIHGLGTAVTVKVPATAAGFEAAARLKREFGARLLMTAVYTPAQALAAAAIGAEGIAPYLGRLNDAGHDGVARIGQMVRVLAGSGTRVLAASVRSAEGVVALREVGVETFTLSGRVLEEMLLAPESEAASAQFEADAANSPA